MPNAEEVFTQFQQREKMVKQNLDAEQQAKEEEKFKRMKKKGDVLRSSGQAVDESEIEK